MIVRHNLIFSFLLFTNVTFADTTLRHFDVYEIPEVGLIVFKPGSPEIFYVDTHLKI